MINIRIYVHDINQLAEANSGENQFEGTETSIHHQVERFKSTLQQSCLTVTVIKIKFQVASGKQPYQS